MLDKKPGVSPVGVGETWRLLFAKCVLKVMVPKAITTCQDYQLCAGLNAVIDMDVHSFQVVWGANFSTDKWVFLLMDTRNVFNDIICIGIIWTVRPLWLFRDRFYLIVIVTIHH